MYKTPQIFELLGQRLFITHGDGLNDKSKIFGFTRKLFHSRLMQRCFDFIHPNIGIPVGRALSNGNRRKHSYSPYRGENDEPLVEFAKNYPASERIDYFIFGHRHILLDLRIATGSRVQAKKDRLCELNVIEQVKNVCKSDEVQRAWARGQSLCVHGLIYSVHDGRLRDLNCSVDSNDALEEIYCLKL